MTSPVESPPQPLESRPGTPSDGQPSGGTDVIGVLRGNWSEEMHSASLYRRLAQTLPEGDARALLVEMADQEVRHAEHWRERIEELGGRVPRFRPGPRELLLPLLARVAGIPSVISFIEGGEAQGRLNYLRQARHLPDQRSRELAAAMIPEEQVHHDAAARLRTGTTGSAPRAAAAYVGDFVRDAVFGLNDGLASNFSLIAGVVGAAPGQGFVLLAGLAGLIAGAISMASGAYLSNRAQREVVESAIRRKAEEIEYDPDEEREELRRIYRLKGFSEDEVEILVRRVTADPQRWLDTLVSEELGLQPHGGPPPVLDGVFTGSGFALGALVPLFPFLFAGGAGALVAAGILSVLALFTVGAAKALFTNRGAVRSGMEMVVIGVGAAVVTNLVGRLFGHAV